MKFNPNHAVIAVAVIGLSTVFFSDSEAQPPGPAAFCDLYQDAPACQAGDVSCDTCHLSPPELNVYGLDIADELLPSEGRPLHEDTFISGLGEALMAVEGLDSDEDGFTNFEEIMAGTAPAQSQSKPKAGPCEDLFPDDGYDVCGYDVAYAYKKVSLDFCGVSPSLLDRQRLLESDDPKSELHKLLDTCLDSEYWRGIDGKVWNLANRKIGPQQAIKTGKDAGPIPLADYDDDFAFWVYTQTDDRDARDVLTGQYFVRGFYEDGTTIYDKWQRTPGNDYDLRGYDTYQAVDKEHRAGLLTHRWFLMSNTMFTSLPRTTAAQAYRAFLGYDISKLEGLFPVADEPKDYDLKGVTDPACATCHTTLDPLAYPFSRYEGIGGSDAENAESYSYNSNRMQGFVWVDGPYIAEVPEAGYLFNIKVQNLVQWAEVASNSDAFAQTTVRDYWRLLFRENPRATEQKEFSSLVSDFTTTHSYNIERMLHALVDTEAYGAP